MLSRNISIILLLFALSQSSSISSVVAQETDYDPVCNANFSKMVVEQQIGESRSIETRQRIRVTLRAADFLWDLDETSARRHFTESFAIALSHFREKGFESSTLGTGSSRVPTRQSDLRTDVIRAVAKRDPQLAAKMADKLLEELEELKDKRKDDDSDREAIELLGIAAQYADTAPDLSVHLFRRAMAYRLNHGWYFYLFSAAGKNQSLADQVYAEAVRHYSRDLPSRFLFLSAYPFSRDRIMGPDRMSYGTMIPASFSPDPELKRLFIQTFFSKIVAVSEDPTQIPERPEGGYPAPEAVYIATALTEIEPIVASSLPDLVPLFADVRARSASLLTGGMKDQINRQNERNSETALSFEERIKLAEKANSEGKLTDDEIIRLLIHPSLSEQHFKLLEPFLPKVRDENLRKEVTSHFWYLRSDRSISDKRFEDAERFAERVPEIDHRGTLILRIIDELALTANTQQKFETLNSLSKLVRSASNSVAKAQILLGLSRRYYPINKSISLDELSEAVRVINQLKDTDLLTSSAVRVLRGRDMGYYSVINLPGADFESVFSTISNNGVDIPLANARAIDDRYYRLLAVLAIAKNCSNKIKRDIEPVVK